MYVGPAEREEKDDGSAEEEGADAPPGMAVTAPSMTARVTKARCMMNDV